MCCAGQPCQLAGRGQAGAYSAYARACGEAAVTRPLDPVGPAAAECLWSSVVLANATGPSLRCILLQALQSASSKRVHHTNTSRERELKAVARQLLTPCRMCHLCYALLLTDR